MTAKMKRREFITLLGGAAVAWPLGARAQQFNKSIRLGFLGPTLNTPPAVEQYEAFRTQLAELGLRDGQNVTIDYKGLDNPRGPFVAVVDLMRSPPDLIVSVGPEASLQAVVGATGFIPVVMIAINYDPLERGYVASLARPGGNITGLVFQQLELAQKQAELLTQAFPERKRVAMLFDGQSADQFGAAERAAKALGLQVQGVLLEKPPYDVDAAFRSATSGGAQMALVLSSPSFLPHRDRIVELANTHRLPSMFIVKHWARAGGLMAYGTNFIVMFQRAAITSQGYSAVRSPPTCRSSRPQNSSWSSISRLQGRLASSCRRAFCCVQTRSSSKSLKPCAAFAAVHESVVGTKRPFSDVRSTSARGAKAEMLRTAPIRLS